MWRIGRTDTFVRTARRFLKRRPHLRGPFERTLELLADDPFHPRLRTHALRVSLDGLYAASITFQVRLIVRISPSERTVILIDVGDHDAVYR